MPRLLSALLLAALCGPAAADTIYKYVDADGHVTFTNVPRPGAKVLMLSPNGSSSRPRKKNASAGTSSDNAGIPAIDPGTQKQRDVGRRRILENELANERKALAQARTALQDAQQKTGTRPEQLQRFRDEVTDRERNIDALNKELGG
ncbi:DUF4124 domain-containing protein [Vogesella sp. LIG4]|uniref:DUF4124 domain-containing protein n=1 Tax=Vogesella sp. LIG4 TaxID=1192162 RepID=UPI00081FA192|nr:DUF4124 domain-containing protein [Vogesella sp. LIG4]SCK17327.1 protein of unknown function [Vogesella sp. LIG4]